MKRLVNCGGFPTQSRWPRLSSCVIAIAVLATFVVTAPIAGLRLSEIINGALELSSSLHAFIVMPDWQSWPTIARPIEESVEMAFLGTTVSIPFCLLLGLLSARNSSGPYLADGIKAILSIGRATPFYCWAMIVVAMVGLGVLPGVIALAITSTLYTAKLFAEHLETSSPSLEEAVLACGAGAIELRRFAIIPQALAGVYSQILYTFEGNIRLSIAMGVVGAGGIGYAFSVALRNLEYPRVLLILVTIYLLVFGVDLVSSQLRARMN